MYYLYARYYAPELGRFITRDSFHGFEDVPASLNQYNYAYSNPVMFVDPSGYNALATGAMAAGLGSSFFIPFVGQVVLVGTGLVIAGVGTFYVGSWVYKKVSDYIIKAQNKNK